MTEYGTLIAYNHDHHAGVIEAEDDGAEVIVDRHDLKEIGQVDLKRHCRVAFDREEQDDGHFHAKDVTMLQPIGAGPTHRHIGDRRWNRTLVTY